MYATATRKYGAVVWNDTQKADDCQAIDSYRMELQQGMSAVAPAPEQDCARDAPMFGNSDILGGSYKDPTPMR